MNISNLILELKLSIIVSEIYELGFLSSDTDKVEGQGD